MRDDGEGEVRAVLTYREGRMERGETRLIREVPLELWLDGERLITIACAGRHREELAVGFLRSEGLVSVREDLLEVALSGDGRQVRVRTAAGGKVPEGEGGRTLASSGARGLGAAVPPSPPLEDNLQVTPEALLALMDRFLDGAALHRRTGGTHAAALVRGGEILAVREDIGRHNTIDMLAGYALLRGVDCRETLLLRTGRVSAEIVQKVRRLGVPLVASLSVPTTLAVTLAEAAGITLVGSLRGGRMNIYSREGRVCR